jgi:methylated-DNA-[protein]-cysteine S-methyltransferase
VEEIYYDSVSSPIGKIWMASNRVGVCLLRFRLREEEFLKELGELRGWYPRADQEINRGISEEIKAFFRGEVIRFSSPLHPMGSPFDMKVWEALRTIPLGETRSYQEIAQEVGSPRGCRAVGGPIEEIPSHCSSPVTA